MTQMKVAGITNSLMAKKAVFETGYKENLITSKVAMFKNATVSPQNASQYINFRTLK